MRNGGALKNLLSFEFMQNYENAPALKFLIRILTGMLTKKEWTIYYVRHYQASQQFVQRYDSLKSSLLLKTGQNTFPSDKT